jgi:peptidoglycan hydrolase CwlO-like protein
MGSNWTDSPAFGPGLASLVTVIIVQTGNWLVAKLTVGTSGEQAFIKTLTEWNTALQTRITALDIQLGVVRDNCAELQVKNAKLLAQIEVLTVKITGLEEKIANRPHNERKGDKP